MQPDREIEYAQQCFDAGIDSAPLVPLFRPIISVHDDAPFYVVDCALRKRDGSLIHPGFVRVEAKRRSALRARSGELECWLLDRCLQWATESKAAGRSDRFCFWITPDSGCDVLVARLLSLASLDSPMPVVVGIPAAFLVTRDACVAVSMAARQAGIQVLVGCDEPADWQGKELAKLCPAFVEVPAESLLSITTQQASDWIESLHARDVKVIADHIETSEQVAALLPLGIDHIAGPLYGDVSTDMDFDFAD